MTYYALISLFPLILFALAVAGFIWSDPAEQADLIDNVLDAVPLDSEGGRSDLEQVVSSVVRARGALGVIGLLAAAYTGSSLFGAIRVSLNQVFEVDDARPLVHAKLVDLAMVVGFGALLLLSMASTVAIALAARFASEVIGTQGEEIVRWSSVLLYLLLPTAVSALTFVLLYSQVARADVTWRGALGGALTASVAFEVLKVGFAEYIAAFGNYDATYGTLGFVIILLLFFFFSAQVMLFGAEVVRADREYASDPSPRELQTLRLKIRSLSGHIPLLGHRNKNEALDGPPGVGTVDHPANGSPASDQVDAPESSERLHHRIDTTNSQEKPRLDWAALLIYALSVATLVVVAAIRSARGTRGTS